MATANDRTFVICLDNSAYPAALEARKIYESERDAEAEPLGLVRIIDESGEGYLYPATMFAPIELAENVRKAFAA